jgi:ribonuclease E
VAREHTKSNIYKARIVAVESNLQAAFVDYGPEKNGFLPFSEIHPEYYRHDVSDKTLQLIEQHQWKKLNINEVLERGQEMLVQVVKEEVGNKGANMTTYLSLPGRCVVLMPGSDSSGISRKITGEERRSQLREIMDSLEIPEGIGWIVRTASIDLTEASLSKDVTYLLKLWGEIKTRAHAMDGVGLVYQDHDCVLRFLREHFDPEIKEILVDDLAAMEKVQDFIDLLPDKQKQTKVRLHKGARPIFNQYNVEDQIESIYQPQVFLPSGGSIVIDPTEALVAIDVNSGSTGKGQNFEDSIFKANMEAATELARQLRLRDLGGLIVVDFIDMRSQKNIREVERQVKVAMKRDKAKVDISRISKFGLMQISRQKLGAPVEALNYQVCPHCLGRGVVRSVETLALFYLRRIQTGASRKMVDRVECRFPLDVAHYLLNNKRQELIDLEKKHRIAVDIISDPTLKPADHEILFHKEARERQVQG